MRKEVNTIEVTGMASTIPLKAVIEDGWIKFYSDDRFRFVAPVTIELATFLVEVASDVSKLAFGALSKSAQTTLPFVPKLKVDESLQPGTVTGIGGYTITAPTPDYTDPAFFKISHRDTQSTEGL